jgi:transposase-like protein
VPVSVVARRHGVRSNLLFRWRKLARQGAFGPPPDGVLSFVPVRVVADGAVGRAVPAATSLRSDRPAQLSALSQAQLAASRRGLGALHRMHLLLACWLEH